MLQVQVRIAAVGASFTVARLRDEAVGAMEVLVFMEVLVKRTIK